MKLSDQEIWELTQLASGAADRGLSTKEHARLEEILSGSAPAREFYVKFTGISAGAAWMARSMETPAAPMRIGGFKEKLVRWSGWAVAAVLAVTAIGVWHHTQRPVVVVTSRDDAAPGVAVLNDAYDVKWVDAQEPAHVGNVLGPGRLRLKSGVAQIQFLNGANVWMEGPAEMELVSAQEGKCESGKVLVDVPREAGGFRLASPWEAQADPGTGFGVDMSTGQGAIHVFRGQVQIGKHGAAPLAVAAGDAMMMDGQGGWRPIAADVQVFDPDMEGGGFEDFGPPPGDGPGPGRGRPGRGGGGGPPGRGGRGRDGLPPEMRWMGGGPPGFGPGGGFGGMGPQGMPPPFGGPPQPFGGPWEDQGGPGGWADAMNAGRWKGNDPVDFVRRQLRASDARWQEIGPAVADYVEAESEAAGEGFPQNAVARAQWDLWLAAGNPDSTPEEVAKRLAAWRKTRDQAKRTLADATDALRERLAPQEEAALMVSGILQ